MALKSETLKICSIKGCERRHSARGLCAPHYTQLWNRDELPPLPPRRAKQPCIVDGCDRWRSSHGYCATHWRRIQRHGDPSVVVERTYMRSGKPTMLGNGYALLYEPEHPLSNKSGQVLVHRKVLYDAIGPGSHPCHHCGRTVTWGASRPDRLDVDHLDGDRQNNERSNLVASCPTCNDHRR